MRGTQSGKHLFDRLVTMHRADCTAAADPHALEREAQDIPATQAAEYSLHTRPVYEDLRRVVGQIAGLLILARLTKRSELLEIAEFESCRARCAHAGDQLRSLDKTVAAQRSVAALKNCQALCDAIVREFPSWKRGIDRDGEFDLMQERLEAAYRFLSASSSVGGGMMMVDFSHACCSCADGAAQRSI